jgi:hypothetical protein
MEKINKLEKLDLKNVGMMIIGENHPLENQDLGSVKKVTENLDDKSAVVLEFLRKDQIINGKTAQEIIDDYLNDKGNKNDLFDVLLNSNLKRTGVDEIDSDDEINSDPKYLIDEQFLRIIDGCKKVGASVYCGETEKGFKDRDSELYGNSESILEKDLTNTVKSILVENESANNIIMLCGNFHALNTASKPSLADYFEGKVQTIILGYDSIEEIQENDSSVVSCPENCTFLKMKMEANPDLSDETKKQLKEYNNFKKEEDFKIKEKNEIELEKDDKIISDFSSNVFDSNFPSTTPSTTPSLKEIKKTFDFNSIGKQK